MRWDTAQHKFEDAHTPDVHPVCRTRTSLGKPYRLSTQQTTPVLVLPRRPTGHAKEWMPPFNWRITSTIILPSIPDCRHLCNLWIFLHLSVVPVCSTTSPILTGTLVAGRIVGHTAENLHSTRTSSTILHRTAGIQLTLYLPSLPLTFHGNPVLPLSGSSQARPTTAYLL